MIQRIQTVWLFLAALVSSLLLLDWYTGYVFHAEVVGVNIKVTQLFVKGYFPLYLLAIIMILLPLITIALFKNRKRQKSLVWVSILASLAFMGVDMMYIENFKNSTAPMPANGSYDIGSALPILV